MSGAKSLPVIKYLPCFPPVKEKKVGLSNTTSRPTGIRLQLEAAKFLTPQMMLPQHAFSQITEKKY